MNHWQSVSLGDVTEVVSGATPKTSVSAYWDGDIPWATPKDLSSLQGAYIAETQRKITQRGLDSCAAIVLPPDSVLFSSRAPIGHVAINKVSMATNQGFKSLVPDQTRLHAKFLFYWLKKHRPYLESLGNGATFKELSKATVSRVRIPLPSIREQERIVRVLDWTEALRPKRRAAREKANSLARSIFYEMFGDPLANPKSWPVLSLAECTARIQIGPFGSLLHQRDYVQRGVPVVNPKHIQGGVIRPSATESVSASKFAELSTFRLEAGDVVMGRRGEMGRCAIVNESSGPLLLGTGSILIRQDGVQTTDQYLYHLLSSAPMKTRLEQLSLGQTLPNLNSSIVEGLEVPLPPLTLQRSFKSIIERTGSLVDSQRKAQSGLDALFESLQHRAFRGEL